MKVVDRVQSRIHQLPGSALATPLPDPGTVLTYGLEHRTINALRRTLSAGLVDGAWTLGRYLGLPRFGGRAIVDILAATEAHEGQLARRVGWRVERQLEEKVTFVVRNLPISETRVRASLQDLPFSGGSNVDLPGLARAWVQRGNSVPFRIAVIGGVRIAVRPSQVTAARAAYRTASRAVAFGGSASVLEITAQLTRAAGVMVDAAFVERLFANLVTFRWIDRAAGVFWFAVAPGPFSAKIRELVSPEGRQGPPGRRARPRVRAA